MLFPDFDACYALKHIEGAAALPQLAPEATRMALDERGYYNVSQAAALLGVSRVSIWRWIRDGRLPAQRLGHRTTRIKCDDLDRLLIQIEPNGARSWHAEDTLSSFAGDAACAACAQKARWLDEETAQRRRAEERLQEALAAEQAARGEADAAQRLRDDFLSIAAHELRNPLAGLSLHAQLALRRLERDTQRDPAWIEHSLQAITDHAGKLARLVDQLLDVSRLEAGKLTLDRHLTNLTTLANHVVAGARARSDRLIITLAAPATLPVWVDPLRLEQVLANLLDNAIKYSPDGGPIDVVLSQPEPGIVELSVRDRGLGIPPEMRSAIFERFFQARDEDAKQGLGLGLYVSRQIVDLHGGAIHAEFPPDGGTRFVIRLPDGGGRRKAEGGRTRRQVSE